MDGSGALPNASTGHRGSLIPPSCSTTCRTYPMDTNETHCNGSHFSTTNFLPLLVFERRLDFCNRVTAAMQPQALSNAHWHSGTQYLPQAQGGAPAGELAGTNAHYIIMTPGEAPPPLSSVLACLHRLAAPRHREGCPPDTLLAERLNLKHTDAATGHPSIGRNKRLHNTATGWTGHSRPTAAGMPQDGMSHTPPGAMISGTVKVSRTGVAVSGVTMMLGTPTDAVAIMMTGSGGSIMVPHRQLTTVQSHGE